MTLDKLTAALYDVENHQTYLRTEADTPQNSVTIAELEAEHERILTRVVVLLREGIEREIGEEDARQLNNINSRIRSWVADFGVDAVRSAIHEQYPTLRDNDDHIRPDHIDKYLNIIPGIAKLYLAYPDRHNIAEATYIRGHIRRMLSIEDEDVCLVFIMDALDAGIQYGKLVGIAEDCSGFEQWQKRIERMI